MASEIKPAWFSLVDESVVAKFNRHVVQTDTCWLWTGVKFKRGYGRISISGRSHVATHIALMLVGSFPDAERRFALHSCDNPACVNPAHLRWGTPAENSRDMAERGRAVRPANRAGEGNPFAKLTAEDVLEIRASTSPYRALAQRFGVSSSNIAMIRTGRSWRHV